MSILTLIGIAVLILGVIVLLKFPERPGGKIAFGSFQVSSIGAGLPLIALGVFCVVIARGEISLPFWTSENGGFENGDGVPGCFQQSLAGIPPERIASVETGTQDFDFIGPYQETAEPFALILLANQTAVGAIKARFIPNNDMFKIAGIVDHDCAEVESYANASRGGDKRVLLNWDTVQIRLGDGEYALRLGHDAGAIGVNYFRRLSP